MSEITLPWVDKLRELYGKCVKPSDALNQLYYYGAREEEELTQRLEESFPEELVTPEYRFKHEEG